MADEDAQRWDPRYDARPPTGLEAVGPPPVLARNLGLVPSWGAALDVACGDGVAAVWLALRGVEVTGVDVSGSAVARATDLAARAGAGERCRFVVADLDRGIPPGPPVDLVLCHLFDAPELDDALVDRVAPGGMLAVAVLSEVGAAPGRFRAGAGALRARFAGRVGLTVVEHVEGDGVASLLARRAPA